MSPRRWSKQWRPLVDEGAKLLRRARGKPRSVAVIEDAKGTLHAGVSISVRDLPASSLCAEPAAVASMRLTGGTKIARILLLTAETGEPRPPCGRCLQFLREFGPRAEVRWGNGEQEHGRSTVSALLPRAFADFRDGSA